VDAGRDLNCIGGMTDTGTEMTNRANFQTSYLRRFLLMAAVGLGWASWCAWDGFVAYPKKLEHRIQFDQLKGPNGEELELEARKDRWKALAAEKGWPKNYPAKKPEEIRGDITLQYLMGAIGLVIGVPALLSYFLSRGSWVEGNSQGLKTSWGQSLNYTDVTRLNKLRWARKGIARAEYTADGRQQVFVFDDFKFERVPLGQMLRDLEAVLKRDQIVGGPTEAEAEAARVADKESVAETSDSGELGAD
jgi:hypothetical protein